MKRIFTLKVLFCFTYSGEYSQNSELGAYLLNLPKEELNQTEIDGIMLMREEEKLAHDVYLTLHNKWGT